jgi:hypothetical protein
MGKDGGHNVSYTIFIDGVQNVLLFADDTRIIESASGVSLSILLDKIYNINENIDAIIS